MENSALETHVNLISYHYQCIFPACHQGGESPSRREEEKDIVRMTPARRYVGGKALAALCGQKIRASLGRLFRLFPEVVYWEGILLQVLLLGSLLVL